MSETIPDRVRSTEEDRANCPECERQRNGEWGPSHDGSRYCESGSIASGGTRAHCTCDRCF